MTYSQTILEFLGRHPLVTIAILHAAVGGTRSIKATEAAVAGLQRDGLIRSYPFTRNRKLYGLTPKGARGLGLDEKRFAKPPGLQAIVQNLSILMFCVQGGHKLLTRREYAERFPELAIYSGLSRNRYFRDRTDPTQTRLGLIVPDFGAHYLKVTKKARREIEKRKAKEREDFKTFVLRGMFSIHVVTGFSAKAALIERALERESVRHLVTVVPDLKDLLEGL